MAIKFVFNPFTGNFDAVNTGGSTPVTPTTFTLANNQSTPADVTGFTVDGAVNTSFETKINIRRFYSTPASASSDGSQSNDVMTNVPATAFSGNIYKLLAQPDQKIVATGAFTSFNGGTVEKIIRLNADGTEDTTFSTNVGTGITGIGSQGRALAILSDGSLIIGGEIPTFAGNTVSHLVKLSSAGVFDTTFDGNLGTGFDSIVYSIGVDSSDNIFVGGLFTTLNGVSVANGIVKLSSAGVLDSTFDTNAGTGFNVGAIESPYSICVQADSSLAIGGEFLSFNGNTRNYLIRLSNAGVEDTAFYTNLGTAFNGPVQSIVEQADTKLVVGGGFTTLNAASRTYAVRLNADGTEDSGFYTNLGTGFAGGSGLFSVVYQPSDAKVVLSGSFTVLDGNTRNRMVRVDSTGVEDTAFYTALGTGFDALIYSSVAVGPSDLIASGGIFTTLDSVSRERFSFLGTRTAATSTNVAFTGILFGAYNDVDNAWDVGGVTGMSLLPTGIDFTMPVTGTVGQLKYTSSNIAGTGTVSEMLYITEVM